jgi:hypothetical protein
MIDSASAVIMSVTSYVLEPLKVMKPTSWISVKQVVMNSSDALPHPLIDFFNLLSDIEPENITQKAIPVFDSLPSVQLIAQLHLSTLTSMSYNSNP